MQSTIVIVQNFTKNTQTLLCLFIKINFIDVQGIFYSQLTAELLLLFGRESVFHLFK